MKKQLLILSALALLSCTREASEEYTELRAGFAPATKIALDSDLNTVWKTGDKVSVFYKGSTFNRSFSYKGEDGAASGTLRCGGKVSSKGGLTLALYPFGNDVSRSADVISATVPTVQNYLAGGIDLSSVLLAAASEDDNLAFEYATAFLALRLECASTSVSVGKVELSSAAGEPIAGEVSISFEDGLKVDASKGVSTITMKGSSGAPLMGLRGGESATFVFSAAAVDLSRGYVFKVYPEGGGDPVVLSYTDPVTLAPGSLRTISGTMALPTYAVTLDLTSSSNLSPALPSSTKKSAADGDAYTFKNTDGKTYEIRICDTSNGYRYSSSCLRVNDGSVTPYTGWIALPAVPSRRLVKIGLEVRNDNGKKVAVSSTSKGGGDIHDAYKFADSTLEYLILTGTKPGAVCYLTDSDKNLQLKRIELFYE